MTWWSIHSRTLRPAWRRPSHSWRPARPRFPQAGHDQLQLQRAQRRHGGRGPERCRQPQRQVRVGRLVAVEAGRRGAHADRLMRAAAVVVGDPVVDDLLGHLQARERRQGGQQLASQRLVEPLHLAGGGRTPDPGEPMGDGVLAADAIEQHLGRSGLAEAAGELAPVVCEDLLGHPIATQRRREGCTHRPAGGPSDQGGDDTEPGVVIQPADQLAHAAIGQPDPAHDVQLPQLHRPLPLPASPVATSASASARLDQLVADQDPVDPSPRRCWRHPATLEFMPEPQRPQPGCWRRSSQTATSTWTEA
jgi:hypothetical protein